MVVTNCMLHNDDGHGLNKRIPCRILVNADLCLFNVMMAFTDNYVLGGFFSEIFDMCD